MHILSNAFTLFFHALDARKCLRILLRPNHIQLPQYFFADAMITATKAYRLIHKKNTLTKYRFLCYPLSQIICSNATFYASRMEKHMKGRQNKQHKKSDGAHLKNGDCSKGRGCFFSDTIANSNAQHTKRMKNGYSFQMNCFCNCHSIFAVKRKHIALKLTR